MKQVSIGEYNRYDFRTTYPLYVKREESLNEVKKF